MLLELLEDLDETVELELLELELLEDVDETVEPVKI